tara:strand:- start:542 stop:760 length:219 start_codon:yes stop_codon:yes gene_type:complete
MNHTEVIVLAGVAVAIVTGLLGGLIWIVNKQVATLLAEHKPNGGTSMKDQLNRIEKKVDNHIDWHMSYVDKE